MCHQEDWFRRFWNSRQQHRHRLHLGFSALPDLFQLLYCLRVIHSGGQFEHQIQFVLEAGFDFLRDWLPGS
jgi:hypothetical protein